MFQVKFDYLYNNNNKIVKETPWKHSVTTTLYNNSFASSDSTKLKIATNFSLNCMSESKDREGFNLLLWLTLQIRNGRGQKHLKVFASGVLFCPRTGPD